MKKILKVFFLTVFLFLFTGCGPKHLDVVDFEKGITLQGEYDDIENIATVILPSGEVLSGKLSTLKQGSNSYSYDYGKGKDSTGTKNKSNNYGYTSSTSTTTEAFGILRSNRSNLIMEMKLNYENLSGNGFGEAKTNDGKIYKVQIRD